MLVQSNVIMMEERNIEMGDFYSDWGIEVREWPPTPLKVDPNKEISESRFGKSM